MHLNDFKGFTSFIGEITNIDFKTWIINFKVPGIIDNMEEYPEADPLFFHVVELGVGNEVFIFKPNNLQDDTYFYLPITVNKICGLKNYGNSIDLTNEGYIGITSDSLEINLKKNLNITVGDTKISISSNGDVIIDGNVKMSGTSTNSSEMPPMPDFSNLIG